MRKLYSVRQKAYLNNPKEEFKLLKYIFEKLIEIITERDLPQKKKRGGIQQNQCFGNRRQQ